MIVVFVSAMNILDKQFTLNNQKEKTHFEVLNVAQVDNLIDVDPQLIWFAELQNQDSFEGELNQLFQEFDFQKNETLTGCPAPDYSKLRFPFPETCNDFSKLLSLQRDISDQILKFQRIKT